MSSSSFPVTHSALHASSSSLPVEASPLHASSSSFLPGEKPEVIETLSFEEIRQAAIDMLQEREPDYIVLESDPAIKVIEAMAYREMLLRQRVNEAVLANILYFSSGNMLDYLGDFHGVERLFGESDERYKERIRLNRRGNSTGGTEPKYRFFALSADVRVRDAVVYRKGKSPLIHVAIFGDGPDGAADNELIEKVSAALHDKSVIMTSDTILVHSAVRIFIDLEADIWLLPESPLALLTLMETALRQAWSKNQRLGKDIPTSWWISKMMIDGVYKVMPVSPAEDIIIEPDQAAAIQSVKLNFKGRGI